MNKIKLFFIYHFRKEGNTRKYTIISFIFLLLLIAILTLRSFVNTHTFLLCVITVVLSIFAIFSEIKKIFNENSLSFLLKNNLITLLSSSFRLLILFTFFILQLLVFIPVFALFLDSITQGISKLMIATAIIIICEVLSRHCQSICKKNLSNKL